MTPVVLGDGAAPVEWAGEAGFTLHAAPVGVNPETLIPHDSSKMQERGESCP